MQKIFRRFCCPTASRQTDNPHHRTLASRELAERHLAKHRDLLDGTLYGTTCGYCGFVAPVYIGPGLPDSRELGTIYSIAPQGGASKLYSDTFIQPWAPLLLASDGNLYGTTYVNRGAPSPGVSSGSVFRITLPDSAKATPVITWPTPADISVGTLLGSAQLNASADVPGTFMYTPAAGTLLGAGNGRPLSVEFTPDDTAHYSSATSTVYIDVNPATPQMTSVGPARLWIGLKNSDAVGLRIDVRTEVLLGETVVGSGELLNTSTGSAGFNNAVLQTVNLAFSGGPVDATPGTQLSLRVSIRRTCTGGGHNSGTVRVWYNGQAVDSGPARDAGSRFTAAIDTTGSLYFPNAPGVMSTVAGNSRMFLDTTVNSSAACPARPFVPVHVWSRALP